MLSGFAAARPVSGELTELVQNLKYSRYQVQHTIGPKVTAKLQLTDTTFAAPAKLAAESAKQTLRSAMKLAAHNRGSGYSFKSGCRDQIINNNQQRNQQ